jgi:hypothetical protein
MSEEVTPPPAGDERQNVELTISGLDRLRIETLRGIAQQLGEAGKLWRYSAQTRTEMLSLAEAFRQELLRRDPLQELLDERRRRRKARS